MLYQRGRVWWWKFQLAGRTYRESTKTRSKSLARDVERTRRREIEAAYNRVPQRRAPRTIEVEVRDWLALKQVTLAPSSYGIAERVFRLHLIPRFKGRLLLDIDAHAIAQYQSRRRLEGASPRSVNLEVETLRALLRHCDLWTHALRRDVRPLKVRDDHGHALTAEEEQRLIATCRASRSPSLLAVFTLAMQTGLRYSELRFLTWGDIDFLKATLIVKESKTAGGTNRVIPINTTALRELQRWATRVPDRQPDHYVFPSEQVGQGGAYRREPRRPIGSWKTAWARAKKRAGVTARFHDIRHTVCTRMLEGGVPLSVVATVLGWSPATTALMARRYGHIGDTARRSAVAVLNDVSAKAGERGHKIGHSDVPVETTEPVGH